ncbi:MAG: tRNA pseudouridine(55) synthase TruB [Endozoicomonadaceae bacterium]|nr:tRNA pseudouridine(55) synthase TruB [Endozoicomonadaceae bacterium]
MRRRRCFKGRDVNGIIIIDKPTGVSSNEVLQQVKRLYAAAKAGHTGSLDPLATGVLPVCLGKATNLSQYLLDSDKHYRAIAKLGVRTNTGDSEGEIVQERPVAITEQDVDAVLETFRGPGEQTPPMYSAIKHNGQPLYKLARAGIEVERKARPITIYRLIMTAFRGDEIELEVNCSKGTYIRTLVEDIGEILGCGAHVINLRRLKSGPYSEENSFTPKALEQIRDGGGHKALDDILMMQDSAVSQMPMVALGEASSFYLMRGQSIQVPRAPTAGFVRIYRAMTDAQDVFLGIGEITDDGLVAPRRLMRQ